jgi:hypothetical protein
MKLFYKILIIITGVLVGCFSLILPVYVVLSQPDSTRPLYGTIPGLISWTHVLIPVAIFGILVLIGTVIFFLPKANFVLMKRSYIILIIGACLIIGGFSFSAASTQMWWSIPNEPPTMRPMEGIDYVIFTLQPVYPIIGFSGIITLVIGIAIFFVDRKKIL